MQEDKSHLLSFGMYGGVYLGLFWVLKYLCVIGSNVVPAFGFINLILSVGTPLVLLYFLVRYRVVVLHGKMGFWHGIQFSILLFFFASMFESVLVFIHVQWIEPTYIGNLYQSMVEVAKTLSLDQGIVVSIENRPLPSSVQYVFSNVLITNLFIGMLLSFVLIPIWLRYVPNAIINPKENESN